MNQNKGDSNMDQKKLSKWLKAAVICMGLCIAVVYFAAVPILGHDLAMQYPEFAYCLWPWLVFIWLTAVPVYAALIFCWRIASSIGKDLAFTTQNAQSCKWISYMAALDGAYFFVGNLVLLFLSMNHPGILLASLLVVVACVAICLAFRALAHMVGRAAALQEQSNLTI